jgi:ATP-binding cassette subfamily F protein uup
VLLVSHDRALLDAVAERTLAIEDRRLVSNDGGWAEYVRRREERLQAAAAPAEPKQARTKPRPERPAPKPRAAPTELERLESEIATREAAVAELERRLAEDWADVETLAAHRRARDELQSLLERWETVFERAQG